MSEFKVFCNRCLLATVDQLLVTSCRHIVCRDCYQKCGKRCGHCKATCKVIKIDSQLPDDMKTYFKPFLVGLRRYEKIVKFQLEQLSIYTGKKRDVLDRNRTYKDDFASKKSSVQELKEDYDAEIKRNNELKEMIRNLRRMEPANPFELNSSVRPMNNNISIESDDAMGPPKQYPSKSFNSSYSSSSDGQSIYVTGNRTPNCYKEMKPVREGMGANGSMDRSSFFVNSIQSNNHSSSSTANNSSTSGGSSFSRTQQVRQMMRSANIRSPF